MSYPARAEGLVNMVNCLILKLYLENNNSVTIYPMVGGGGYGTSYLSLVYHSESEFVWFGLVC